MKQYILILLIQLLATANITVSAQQNVVLLVDVSGSIPYAARNGAKDMIKDVLMGRAISSPSFYYEKDPQSSMNMPGSPMVSNGSHVLLIRFGEKETSNSPVHALISNYPQDLGDFIDAHYPSAGEYRDQLTYLTLAKAKAVQEAKRLGMSRYMFLLISDNINDDDTHGKSPNYTQYEQQLVDNYNSQSNKVFEGAIEGYVRLRGSQDFKVPLRTIDVSQVLQVPLPQGQPPKQVDTPAPEPLSIEFTGSLASATRKNPVIVNSGSVSISWLCKNCPDNTLYQVAVSDVDGKKPKDVHSKNLSLPSVTKILESGTYKIAVSGEVPSSSIPVSSAVTYVTVDTDTGLWWIWILLISGVIGGAIYWNKQQQKKKLRESARNESVLDDVGGQSYSREEF